MTISLCSFIRCVLRLLLATAMVGTIGCSTVSNSEPLPVFTVAENSQTTLAALTESAPVELPNDLLLDQSFEQVLEMETPLAIATPNASTLVNGPNLPTSADASPSNSQEEAIRRALVLAELKKRQIVTQSKKEAGQAAQAGPVVFSEVDAAPNPRLQSVEWNRNPLR